MSTANYNASWDGKRQAFFPVHRMVKNWMFQGTQEHVAPNSHAEAEAHLADAMARVAELNGITVNDLQHLFPAVLRMLKSKSEWAR